MRQFLCFKLESFENLPLDETMKLERVNTMTMFKDIVEHIKNTPESSTV